MPADKQVVEFGDAIHQTPSKHAPQALYQQPVQSHQLYGKGAKLTIGEIAVGVLIGNVITAIVVSIFIKFVTGNIFA